MENLNIEATGYTPSINADFENGTLEIKGKSYPENTYEFYEPFITNLEAFFADKNNKKLTVNLEIIYFNSSSSKLFFDMLDILEENNSTCNIEVNWIYDIEDESSLEVGEEFQDSFENLKLNLVVKS
jgi:hypothetical protein